MAKKPTKATSKKTAGAKAAKTRKKTARTPKAATRKRAATTKRAKTTPTRRATATGTTTKRSASAKRKTAAAKKSTRKKTATPTAKKTAKAARGAATRKTTRQTSGRGSTATRSSRRSKAGTGKRSRSSGTSATSKRRSGNPSGLSAKDIEFFRERLLERRARLLGDVSTLQDEARSQSGGSTGVASSMPIHMADLGTDNYEKEFTLNLIQGERSLLREIDEALARINDGTYGICLATGKPIGKARLKAKPWAKYCYEYVLEMERRQHGSGY